MQGTTDFHHEIADAVLPQPDAVFDDATALDATVDMLDAQPTLVQGLALLLDSGGLSSTMVRETHHLIEAIERRFPQRENDQHFWVFQRSSRVLEDHREIL
jgi:hypothetical protein